MSDKVSFNSRFKIKFKALKVRSSRVVCDERLACTGNKPFAVFSCTECHSNQCQECDALLHEDSRLIFHQRKVLARPSDDELCEGNCEDPNFADLSCASCERNFCILCDHLIHVQGKQSHIRTKFISTKEEFLSCEDFPDQNFPEFFQDSVLEKQNTNEMLSLESLHGDDMLPDLFPEQEIKTKLGYSRSAHKSKSFLLLNDKESLQVASANEFVDKLGCGNNCQLKVVSIFGNTGDGKSYTLNKTFFDGWEVFKTSSAQDACTFGVWAAYCPSLEIIVIDTEGFLGQASNPNIRARMLLKVLAISDIIIYRTRAERLHNDMFSFLGDASSAYTRHFSQELEEACARCSIEGPVSVLGPGVIIFHETQHTNVLSKVETEPELILRGRFQELNLKVHAFSSLEYIGICSRSQPTNFDLLRSKVEKHIQNSSVRVARSPVVIYKLLKDLNEKFCGKIEKTIPNTFPDQYFTCSARCKSCKCRCIKSMNHEKDGTPHDASDKTACIYQHQYENRVFLCKACFEGGKKIVVSPKTMEKNDSSWLGFAKYAWSGYILECSKCGVIYRSRQYWYGNQDPWETCVRTEICHMWPMVDEDMTEEKNTARYMIDNIASVSEVVSSISAKPTRVLTSWVADQIAPSYWTPNSQITKCGHCEKDFNEEKKHHCRVCGGGFCEECSSNERVVPTWGFSPVRVCPKCLDDDNLSAQSRHNPPEVTVRKLGEAVQTTLGTVATAVSYPLGFIKDSARPSYWVADHLLVKCFVCEEDFGPKLLKHHCRACGEGVCHNCSKTRLPVPSRGWNYKVRICDKCVPEVAAPKNK